MYEYPMYTINYVRMLYVTSLAINPMGSGVRK